MKKTLFFYNHAIIPILDKKLINLSTPSKYLIRHSFIKYKNFLLIDTFSIFFFFKLKKKKIKFWKKFKKKRRKKSKKLKLKKIKKNINFKKTYPFFILKKKNIFFFELGNFFYFSYIFKYSNLKRNLISFNYFLIRNKKKMFLLNFLLNSKLYYKKKKFN